MSRPTGQFNQYEGKGSAELHRGSGSWPPQPYAVALEPPFEPYDRQTVNIWDCAFNDWEGDWQGQYHVLGPQQPILLPKSGHDEIEDDPSCIAITQFPDDEATIDKAIQLLMSLPHPSRPVAFEVAGVGARPNFDNKRFTQIMHQRVIQEREGREQTPLREAIIGWKEPFTAIQLTCDPSDADTLTNQLRSHYPNSAVEQLDWYQEGLSTLCTGLQPGRDGFGAELVLSTAYCLPLKTVARLDTDPLALAITAMEHLDRDEWAVLQILFKPCRFEWGFNLQQAVQHPYKDKEMFTDISMRDIDAKLTSPLFAVSVRVMAATESVYEHLLGWASQFAAPPQRLVPALEHNLDDLSVAIKYRFALRPGLILNTQELASLVHLPAKSVVAVSERLKSVTIRTQAAPALSRDDNSIHLGSNTHAGRQQDVWVPGETRTRHCYIAGASGTGKSTLLLNLIKQDVAAGHGVGVIDPHGDLIDAVLDFIPKERIKDTVYFNPADIDYPPAFNFLQCKDTSERERVVAETVETIHRFFADSWGPQLEQYLTYALVTLLEHPGSTLADLNKLLTDENVRRRIVSSLTDPMLLTFWNHEFAKHAKHAVRPILNKLVPFLLYPTVRHVIEQSPTGFDFDNIINHRKILLVRLPVGPLSEKMIGIFGTFVMSKLVSAAFRREKLDENKRVPFYLYIDEFQNFVNLAVSFDRVLSEARKYKLVLAGLANQYVDQLPRNIRSAVFGNVKTMVIFRVSPMDARLLCSEFKGFTAEEITSLDTGQAIARVGGSKDSFNLICDRPPQPPEPSYSKAIILRCRRKYARRLKELTGPELVCDRYLTDCRRSLEGKSNANEKLLRSVEKLAGIKEENKMAFRRSVIQWRNELELEGEEFTAHSLPQLTNAFETIWQRFERQEASKKQPPRPAQKVKPDEHSMGPQFVLTSQWQAVPPGAELPSEVETKVEGGVTYARLPEGEVAARIVPGTDTPEAVRKVAGGREPTATTKPASPTGSQKRKATKPKTAAKNKTESPQPAPLPTGQAGPSPARASENVAGNINPDDDFA